MIEKIKPYINFIVIAFVAVLFVLLCRGYLYYNGSRADEIGKQLEQAGSNQQQLTDGIRESTMQTQDIREEIGNLRGQLSNLREQEQSAGSLIEDCKQILATVRQRGKANKD